MSDTKEIEGKPLVNHRWNLPCLGEMIDQMLPEWPTGEHPDFSGIDGHARLRNAFEQFAHGLLRGLGSHLEKAAGKGISEALALIRNPDYYETVKRRRSRSIEQGKKWRAEQDKQAKERERRMRGELTEEERINELASITHDLNYHQTQIDKLKLRKAQVDGTSPVSFAKGEPKAMPNLGDDNEWPDRISFD